MTIQRRVYTLGRCLPTEHLDCSIITARLLGMMVFLLWLSLFTRRQAFMHAGGRRLFLIQWISMTEKGERKMQQTWGSIRIPWKRTPHKQSSLNLDVQGGKAINVSCRWGACTLDQGDLRWPLVQRWLADHEMESGSSISFKTLALLFSPFFFQENVGRKVKQQPIRFRRTSVWESRSTRHRRKFVSN